MKEFDLLKWIWKKTPTDNSVSIGPGDDAAVSCMPAGLDVVSTVDQLIEGRHFNLHTASYDDIGYKVIARSLSDIAAMGAAPVFALATIAMHEGVKDEDIKAIYNGATRALKEWNTPLIGGDVSSTNGPLHLTSTLIGGVEPKSAFTRSGANAGDAIFVTGSLGGSILGHHLTFTPRIKEALHLRSLTTVQAMMDISDGISGDIIHLCDKSGVGCIIDADKIPISKAARTYSKKTNKTPLYHALHDGEDYELLFAIRHEDVNALLSSWALETKITRIGTFTQEKEIMLKQNNEIKTLDHNAWEHII